MVSTSKTRIRSYCELSETLDRLAGRTAGHALRTCLIGYPMGRELGFTTAQLGDLLTTILIKDLVASHTSEFVGHGAILRLFERLQKAFGRMAETPLAVADSHAVRLDDAAERLSLASGVKTSLRALREHWDGTGPLGLEANAIPLFAAIALVAEAAEMAWSTGGAKAARSAIRRGSGRIFSPEAASAFDRASCHARYWAALETPDLVAAVAALEPDNASLPLNDAAQAAIAGVTGELSLRLLGLRAAGSAATPRARSRNRKAA